MAPVFVQRPLIEAVHRHRSAFWRDSGEFRIAANEQMVGGPCVRIARTHLVEPFLRAAFVQCEELRRKRRQQIWEGEILPDSRHVMPVAIAGGALKLRYRAVASPFISEKVVEYNCLELIAQQTERQRCFGSKGMPRHSEARRIDVWLRLEPLEELHLLED